MPFDHPIFGKLKNYKFILGSSSPRRKEILANNVNVTEFSVVKSTFEENLSKENISDVEYVTTTAEHKILSIIDQLSPGAPYILLVADTVVSCGEKIFEKPETRDKQMEMLQHYRNHPNAIRVITSVHVVETDSSKKVLRHLSGHETTALRFNENLPDDVLQSYVDSGEGIDVAGGFKYQNLGCLLFSGIDGDYFNVVGLPAAKTFFLLDKLLS